MGKWGRRASHQISLMETVDGECSGFIWKVRTDGPDGLDGSKRGMLTQAEGPPRRSQLGVAGSASQSLSSVLKRSHTHIPSSVHIKLTRLLELLYIFCSDKF